MPKEYEDFVGDILPEKEKGHSSCKCPSNLALNHLDSGQTVLAMVSRL